MCVTVGADSIKKPSSVLTDDEAHHSFGSQL